MPVQIAFYLLLGIALFDGFAFVKGFFPFSEADLEFGVAVFVEEDAKRDDGVALFLYLIFQFAQFPFGKQQFAVVYGEMIIGGAEAVFGDMHVPDPQFSLEEDAEAVDEVYFPVPDGFYFRPGQDHPCIKFVFDEIVVIGGAVLYFFCIGDNLEFINEIFLLVRVIPAKPVVVAALEP